MSTDIISRDFHIACDDWETGDGFQIGDDVIIECRKGRIGNDVRIGMRTDQNFHRRSGVRIKVDELVLGDGVSIGREVFLQGGRFQLDRGVKIRGGNTFHIKKLFRLQPYGVVNEDCEITGVDIDIGRYLWMLPYAKIGGGSAFEVHSVLRIGHFCHLGMYSFINTARMVNLGDEVGLGTRTSLYTHGAYPSILKGFPVAFDEICIGDRSWLPGATVNPGVTVGHDCVIGVGSVVTRDIPAGSLAAGVPAEVIKENVYPQELSFEEKQAVMEDFLQTFSEICSDRHKVSFSVSDEGVVIIRLDGNNAVIAYTLLARTEWISALQDSTDRVICLAHTYENWPEASELPAQLTLIDLDARHVMGMVDSLSERLFNQLRRYGVRFRYSPRDRRYVAW
jgi:acetyltransferase-like isoleucine patch superfamily enzyme